MYCSSCGAAVAQALSYCNHCGAKLSAAKGDSQVTSAELSPDSLVRGIVSVLVLGVGVIIALMTIMKRVLDADLGLINAFAMMIFLLMLVVEGVFIWLLLSRTRGAKRLAGETGQAKGKETKELEAAQARALPEPVPSVTEQTTRTFDPVYGERRQS